LAETGIGEAYERLLPELRKYVPQPERLDEVIDNDTPIYSVRCGGKEHAIYGPGLSEEGGGSWGRATVAFFAIVNGQLAVAAYRFFAINGGNDLGGMFLTPAQAQSARASLPRCKRRLSAAVRARPRRSPRVPHSRDRKIGRISPRASRRGMVSITDWSGS
jgi:hypothetical protein